MSEAEPDRASEPKVVRVTMVAEPDEYGMFLAGGCVTLLVSLVGLVVVFGLDAALWLKIIAVVAAVFSFVPFMAANAFDDRDLGELTRVATLSEPYIDNGPRRYLITLAAAIGGAMGGSSLGIAGFVAGGLAGGTLSSLGTFPRPPKCAHCSKRHRDFYTNPICPDGGYQWSQRDLTVGESTFLNRDQAAFVMGVLHRMTLEASQQAAAEAFSRGEALGLVLTLGAEPRMKRGDLESVLAAAPTEPGA